MAPRNAAFSSRPGFPRSLLLLTTLLAVLSALIGSTMAQGEDTDIVITSPAPGEVWTRRQHRTIEWTGTKPETFSIGLVNRQMSPLVNAIAIANNVQTSQGKVDVNLDSIPPGQTFQIVFYDVADISKAYAVTRDFAIQPDHSSTAPTSVTATTGATTTAGTNTQTRPAVTGPTISMMTGTSTRETLVATMGMGTNAASTLRPISFSSPSASTFLIMVLTLCSLILGALPLLV